jgi:O-antigen/teichoic acid export membrane protein
MPQVPFGLLNQAMSMADRFILGLYMPLRAIGLYLIGTTIAGVIKFYPVAFEAAWMPFAYDSLKRNDAAPLFARLGTYAFAILALLTVALAGLAPPLVRLALPPEYHQVAPLIPILTLAMAVQALSWFMVTSLNVAKQTRVYPVVTAIGATASVVANLLLIPSLGMFGAALALLLSQTLTSAVTLYFAQRAYPIPYEFGRLSKAGGIAALIYGAMTLAPSASPWQSLAVRTALLTLFPLGLLLLRFFHPREIGELRRLMESRIPA